MKKISSSFRRKPYVFSFYLKSAFCDIDKEKTFPCMTHAFYCDSLNKVQSHLHKLLLEYHHLGIDLIAYLEDSLDIIDVDDIVQHYNTQLIIDF